MPFGTIGRTGPGMRQLVGFGDRSTRRGTFGAEFEVCHCIQWGLYGICLRQCRNTALFPNYFAQTCFTIIIAVKQIDTLTILLNFVVIIICLSFILLLNVVDSPCPVLDTQVLVFDSKVLVLVVDC